MLYQNNLRSKQTQVLLMLDEESSEEIKPALTGIQKLSRTCQFFISTDTVSMVPVVWGTRETIVP